MLCINDLHLGVNRQAGTTPVTQGMLRHYLRRSTEALLDQYRGDVVTINGDLFDGFTVDIIEVVRAFEMFADWLRHGGRLNLVMGNHDSNPRGDKMSSFHVLCRFLQSQFPDKVKVFDKGFEWVANDVWCIPHQANQDCFDIEIARAVEAGKAGRTLLLHCNYKNGFAENSDHSLNLGDEQVGALMVAGWNIVLGHEHQGYSLRGGRVLVVGNQFPSSCMDCHGDEAKHALIIDEDGAKLIETWQGKGNYTEVDWHNLDAFEGVENFVRVVGDCTALEAADMVNAVAKLRQISSAFVIANGVKVEGLAAMDTLSEMTFENISKFNVMEALLETLDDREKETVKGLQS